MNLLIYKITVISHNRTQLENAINRVLEACEIMNLTLVSSVKLPTKINKITVLRSPHVHKKSREQFEIRKYKRFIIIKVINNTVISRSNVDYFTLILNKLVEKVPFGVLIKANLIS